MLDEIGFYTLSDVRARTADETTPLSRCELILTDRCNFACPYCRGLRKEFRGDMPLEIARRTVALWIDEGLKNVRFSGGEPTLYAGLLGLVEQCRDGSVERVAISSNGSATRDVFRDLVTAGVDDFSISLDGGCCSVGDEMSGGIAGTWHRVVESIEWLAARVYVTVGMVFTERNVSDCVEAVRFAHRLGVADIRVIPSAQYNRALTALAEDLEPEIAGAHPILRYRVESIRTGRHVRGPNPHKCWLALDDMACAGGYHFPCIIYMREGGEPIGRIGEQMRAERAEWVLQHEPAEDPICGTMCLDVCREYCRVGEEARRSDMAAGPGALCSGGQCSHPKYGGTFYPGKCIPVD